MPNFDAIIVGAGIVGSACARELALAGLRIAIVEAGQPGAATTSAGMGHVVAMDDSPAQLALTAYSRAVWQEQAAILPQAAAYHAPGTIWVAVDDEEMAEVHARHRTYDAAGIRTEILTPAELATLEPNLREGLTGALFVPGDGICHPPGAAAFYLADAQRLGAQLCLGRAIFAANGQVALEDGTRLEAPNIILATGVECELLPSLPIRKRKGHLAITSPLPDFLHHQIVELGYLKSAHKVEADSVAFNVQPRPDGRVMIGASRQYGSEDPAIDPHIVTELLSRARAYMPAIASAEIGHVRTGFRAATPDKLPVLGPAKGLSDDVSLWLAVGFEGLGITSAPGAARLLTDALLGRESPIDRTSYLPLRFQKENA